MSAINSSTFTDFSTALDNHASLIDISVADVNIPSNGNLELTLTDGSTVNNSIPFFPNFLIGGLVLSLQAIPNANLLDYTTGSVQIDGVVYTVGAAGTLNLNPGALLPRWTLIYVDNTSTVGFVDGIASATPTPPSLPANSIQLALIFVAAGASAATGGFYLQNTNYFSTSAVLDGSSVGQTLYWDGASWIPSSNLEHDGNNIGLGGSVGAEKVKLYGAMEIEDYGGAPVTTTNMLYNNAGQLYWDTIPLGTGTLPVGTVTDSTLRWNGAAWVENVNFKTNSTRIKNEVISADRASVIDINTPSATDAYIGMVAHINNPLLFNSTIDINNSVQDTGSTGHSISTTTIENIDNVSGFNQLWSKQVDIDGLNTPLVSEVLTTNNANGQLTVEYIDEYNVSTHRIYPNIGYTANFSPNYTHELVSAQAGNSLYTVQTINQNSGNRTLYSMDDGTYLLEAIDFGTDVHAEFALNGLSPINGLTLAHYDVPNALTNTIDSVIDAANTEHYWNVSAPIKIGGMLALGAQSVAGGTTHNVIYDDGSIFLCNTAGGAITINITAGTLVGNSAAFGALIIVKDSGGNAGTNNITINIVGGTIDGAASYVLNVNYGSISIVTQNNTNFFIV